MAFFAKIRGNIVQDVIVADEDFLKQLPLEEGEFWLETDPNTKGGIHYGPDGEPDGQDPIRGNFASRGDTWDAEEGVFYSAQPFPSWIIGFPCWTWKAPVDYPEDGNYYVWNEDTVSWERATAP